MGVKFRTDDLRDIALFEKITKARVVDCIPQQETIYFVVNENKLGSIIGKNGEKIKNLEKLMRKRIKIFKYSDNIKTFTEHLITVPVNEIKIKNNVVKVNVSRRKKPIIVGKNGEKIKIIKEFLRRKFKISDIVLE